MKRPRHNTIELGTNALLTSRSLRRKQKVETTVESSGNHFGALEKAGKQGMHLGMVGDMQPRSVNIPRALPCRVPRKNPRSGWSDGGMRTNRQLFDTKLLGPLPPGYGGAHKGAGDVHPLADEENEKFGARELPAWTNPYSSNLLCELFHAPQHDSVGLSRRQSCIQWL